MKKLKKKLILASASPRRKAILKSMGLTFEVVPSPYEESLDNSNFTYEKIENLALNKARGIVPFVSNAYILAADTVVVLDDEILGKPKDRADAVNMLEKLSNREHFVVTSVCLINTKTQKEKIYSETSYVEFNKLSNKMIEDYIENFSPMDKAGSYGIQELPSGFVKNVKGSFENIVGLCPKAVEKLFSLS